MEIFSTLLALCEGKPPFTGGFPSQRPATEQTIEQTIERLVIRDAIALIMKSLWNPHTHKTIDTP